MAEETEVLESPWETVEPRSRAMPLVPEPFKKLSVARQGAFLGDGFMTKDACEFFPNLNIPEYVKQLSDAEMKSLEKRANNLKKHTMANHMYQVSESSWEADIRNDVFGKIRDDIRLRIDKRPYEFLVQDGEGNTCMKRRIPDATMGLTCYTDFDLSLSSHCERPDCNQDHSDLEFHPNFSQKRLRSQMHDPECGLVVDGVWGKTDILFPWAVYEAKKRGKKGTVNYEKAEYQVYHAVQTYLAMLDDLARDPNNVHLYQSEESKKYQMFCFVSCGRYWQVFIATPFLEGSNCLVELIWEGFVDDFSRAFDLICIVDQVHQWAITQHMDFVIKHLERWHKRHEEIQMNRDGEKLPIADLFDEEDFDPKLLYGIKDVKPRWYELKEADMKAMAMKKLSLKRKYLADTEAESSEATAGIAKSNQ